MSNDLGVPRKWVAPASGLVKCNFHTNLRNDRHLTGGAWITRDHRGDVLRSLRDLRLEAVSIGTDSQSSDYCGSRARETKTISEFKLALYSLLVISLCLFTAVYLEIKDGSINVKTVVNLTGKGYE
ncbi:hypothetical protein F2Q69_00009812 [Brassica cretica]|uniref:Uncharacterized protein n=1 Tax=Brassica cretica TaxID=69181 RepID=A0A8S9P946_BRACR|nr:hypothetical protein F2Q69_00009812 [Brassica cretica]